MKGTFWFNYNQMKWENAFTCSDPSNQSSVYFKFDQKLISETKEPSPRLFSRAPYTPGGTKKVNRRTDRFSFRYRGLVFHQAKATIKKTG